MEGGWRFRILFFGGYDWLMIIKLYTVGFFKVRS